MYVYIYICTACQSRSETLRSILASHTLSYMDTHPHSCKHLRTLTYMVCQSQSETLSSILACTLSLSQTQTHTHAHIHIHTYTHSVSIAERDTAQHTGFTGTKRYMAPEVQMHLRFNTMCTHVKAHTHTMFSVRKHTHERTHRYGRR